jgi:exonuclease III
MTGNRYKKTTTAVDNNSKDRKKNDDDDAAAEHHAHDDDLLPPPLDDSEDEAEQQEQEQPAAAARRGAGGLKRSVREQLLTCDWNLIYDYVDALNITIEDDEAEMDDPSRRKLIDKILNATRFATANVGFLNSILNSGKTGRLMCGQIANWLVENRFAVAMFQEMNAAAVKLIRSRVERVGYRCITVRQDDAAAVDKYAKALVIFVL